MLLYVLDSHGSSPGRQGFLMGVNAKGEIAGSIGGGIMEHKFVEMAKERLRQPQNELSIRTQYHDKQAAQNQSGMICSGDQTILLYRIQSEDHVSIQQIVSCLTNNRNGLLELSPDGLRFDGKSMPDWKCQFSMQSEREWLYRERLGYKNNLTIIGGGHCALALSRIMSQLDFYIRVIDHRSGLHTLQANDTAHEIIVIDSYDELTNIIPSGHHQFVVVMTVGYRTDDLAIRAVLSKSLQYLGVLGSAAKITKLVADYRLEGIPEEQLARMHAPIGLPIHSQTPDEIAISIAAQIIQVKNSPET
ncbi:XdhC family protein [Spirosoma harenae]